jgi:hypothetical protein
MLIYSVIVLLRFSFGFLAAIRWMITKRKTSKSMPLADNEEVDVCEMINSFTSKNVIISDDFLVTLVTSVTD